MAEKETPGSYLQELELSHADDGQLADMHRSAALASDERELGRGYFMSPQLIGSILSISLSVVASYFGFIPAAAVISTINADIGPSENAGLFSIIWSISQAIMFIIFGRTSDKFGRRWFVIGGCSLGFVGGIIACTAQSMPTLVGANVLLGLASGVATCYGLLVGEICPNKYKSVGVALCLIPNVIPVGFGAYIGIMLTHNANWRWIYYIFLILMGMAIGLQVAFYHPPTFRELHGEDRTVRQEIRRVDYIGAVLITAGLCTFLLGVSWGGEPHVWTSSIILGLLIGGAVTLVLFVLWEMFSNTPNPLLPTHFFRDIRGFDCLIVIASVSGSMFTALSIIWPSQVARIFEGRSTSWQSNAWMSTTIQFGVYSGILVLGPLLPIVKNVKFQMIFLMAMGTAFMGALVSCSPDTFSQSAAFSFLSGFPAGVLELYPGLLIQMDANDADLGTVFAIVFLFKAAAGSILAAVYIAILNNKTPFELQKYVPPAAIEAGLPSSSLDALYEAVEVGTSAALAEVPGMTADIEAAVQAVLPHAYSAAYAYVYYAAIAVGGFGLLACIYMKSYDHLFNTHVPRTISKFGRKKPQHRSTDVFST